MGKRMFTKCFSGQAIADGLPPAYSLNIAPWLMQEDISILGVDMDVRMTTPSENDGFTSLILELSQVGAWGTDGSIASVSGGEGWNTTPAGIQQDGGHTSLMFPESIDVKEEGAIYLHSLSQGKSAGQTAYNYHIVVYYTKGGSRR